MSMVIGTNVASLSAQRHLETSRASMETSMERLSSGKRINSAMDDSAGLTISHRLEAKITGMNQGIRNANDGISMLQTAEGALEETSNMLNRMKELATQASSATYSQADRLALNKEFQALATQITNIATQTDFNGTNVLNSDAAVSFQVGDSAADSVSVNLQSMKAGDLDIFNSKSAVVEEADAVITTEHSNALHSATKKAGHYTITSITAEIVGLEMDVNGTTYTQSFDASVTQTMQLLAAQISADQTDILATNTAGTRLTLTSLSNGVDWSSSGLNVVNDTSKIIDTAQYAGTTNNTAGGKQAGNYSIGTITTTSAISVTVNGREFTQDFITDSATTVEELVYQINDGTTFLNATTAGATNILLKSTKDGQAFTAGDLVLRNKHGGSNDVLTAAGALEAINAIDNSIKEVDSYRSSLGAVANQLDHTVANLMSRVENQSAAKSRIEDTDFAVESANLAKAQVLQQAGTAMLAQANASGQSVLSLLK